MRAYMCAREYEDADGVAYVWMVCVWYACVRERVDGVCVWMVHASVEGAWACMECARKLKCVDLDGVQKWVMYVCGCGWYRMRAIVWYA